MAPRPIKNRLNQTETRLSDGLFSIETKYVIDFADKGVIEYQICDRSKRSAI